MLTPKENYLKMLSGEIPDYVPSSFEPYSVFLWNDDFQMPAFSPRGFSFNPWGVRFVGTRNMGFGSIPEPGRYILKDITKWRDAIVNPNVSEVDFESYYKKDLEGKDRENFALVAVGGDYFQTLVAFMGFEEAIMAMVEEPEEVKALLEYISEFSLEVLEHKLDVIRPDIYMVADDCAAAHAPFFSPDMYRELIKPFHKKHADMAISKGALVTKHDCGRSEVFIDDWLDIGVKGWNPAEKTNDLKAIKKKYVGRLAIEGGWDYQAPGVGLDASDDEFVAAMDEYVATFAPGGGFIFSIVTMGNREDERVARRAELVKNYFYDNVRDYYNTH